jgi:hypothetical protein
MSNEEIITEKTKVAFPIKAWVIIIISICSVVFSVAMVYSKLQATDENLTKGLEKKVDREEFNKQKFIDSIKNNETNRKLGLIMEHLKIPDYGQESNK